MPNTIVPTPQTIPTQNIQPSTPEDESSSSIPSAQAVIGSPMVGGEIAIKVDEASSTLDVKTGASATVVNSPHIYKFEKKVRWKGENYILKIDVPCQDWQKRIKEGELTTAALTGEIENYADHFTADLFEQLEKETGEKKINPGDDFEVLFTNDGYYAFVPSKGFNPFTASPEEIETLKQVVSAKSPPSVALSQIVTLDNLAEMRCKLDALKHKAKTADTLQPVNLVHHKNNCYINAAFQQLVNDPDPEVQKALRNPKNYTEGQDTNFYRAIQTYEKHQRSGRESEKCDIGTILGLDDKSQGDGLLDAMGKFRKFFKEKDSDIDSSIVSFFNTHQKDGYKIEKDSSLAEFASNAVLSSTSLPDSISVYTPRLVHSDNKKLSELFDSNFKEKFKDAINNDLNQDEKRILQKKFPDSFGIAFPQNFPENDYRPLRDKLSAELKTSNNNQPSTKEEIAALDKYYHRQLLLQKYQHPITLDNVDTILDNANLLESAIFVISKNLKETYREKRKENLQLQKVDTPIQINQDGKVKVRGQTYDLVSFQAHLGLDNAGHYVTYLRKGDRCWIMDDLKPAAESISLSNFIDIAQTSGCYYRLHKEGLLATSAPSSEITTETQTTKNTDQIKKELNVGNLKTLWTLETERGELKNVNDFTWVNPTDSGLNKYHKQVDNALSETQRVHLKTEIVKSIYRPWYRPNVEYKPRGRIFGPEMLLTSKQAAGVPIIHLPLTELRTLADVGQATFDALHFAMDKDQKKIAFPVFECNGQDEDAVLDEMKKAILNFLEKNKKYGKKEVHVKIICPIKSPTLTNNQPQDQDVKVIPPPVLPTQSPVERIIPRPTKSA